MKKIGAYYVFVLLLSIVFFSSCKKEKEDVVDPIIPIVTPPKGTLPSVTTTSVTSIGENSAVCGGTILSAGSEVVNMKGICFSTSSSPVLGGGTYTSDVLTTTDFTHTMTGLSPNTTYYARAYALSKVGTAYGNQVTFKTNAAFAYSIGDVYQGGILAYILLSGDPGFDSNVPHGLIAAPTDQSTGLLWTNNYTVIGTTGTAIGTGATNTATIYSTLGAGTYAAQLCSDLVLGGYSDWYLPSAAELNKIYNVKSTVGGFGNYWYWTSSEVDYNHATRQNFSTGYQGPSIKNSAIEHVRAVRSF